MGFVLAVFAAFLQLWSTVSAAPETTLNITAFTNNVDSDWTAVYYAEDSPLLIGNDGSANGGLRAYSFQGDSPLPETKSKLIGRTKIVTVAHNVGGRDLAIAIAAPDSIIRVYELPDFRKADEEFKLIGDWSAMCSWRSKSRNQYFFIFGKGRAVQFLIRPQGEDFEIVEVGNVFRASRDQSADGNADTNVRAAIRAFGLRSVRERIAHVSSRRRLDQATCVPSRRVHKRTCAIRRWRNAT